MNKTPHEEKVEALLEIIAQAQVASFAFNVSLIPDSNVTIKNNSTTMVAELAADLAELLTANPS